jgi:hypothetical protein
MAQEKAALFKKGKGIKTSEWIECLKDPDPMQIIKKEKKRKKKKGKHHT